MSVRTVPDDTPGLVRSMKTDVKKIAKNTGFDEKEIKKIKKFIFLDKHDLGYGAPCRFDSDFAIAQSWQRLISGDYQPHDITLLRHEQMENMLIESGLSQREAHIQTSAVYDYNEEVKEFYGSFGKNKKE